MQIQDFDFYKELLKRESGLVVTPEKTYLLVSRLTPVAKKWDFDNIDHMTFTLKGLPDKGLLQDIIEAMTTNETSFFRDLKPFDLFKDVVMPPLIEARKDTKKIRIWCAACSSGQEPYSLAMLMREEPLASKLAGFNVEIIATDISEEILKQAKNAVYSQFEVQRGLPITMLMKYFSQDGEKWKLKPELQENISFRTFNLLEPTDSLGSFDIIFCRNVLIYFDQETKKDILERMSKNIKQDGYLFLGGAETVLGITEAFKLKENTRGLYIPGTHT
jgi:chemotaxis protein methyltransferase CheR